MTKTEKQHTVKKPKKSKRERVGKKIASPPASLLRCVLSPESMVVADVACHLPASAPSLWVGAFPDVVERAWESGLLSAHFGEIKGDVATFLSQWHGSLEAHIMQNLALANKADACVLGYEALMRKIPSKQCGLLIIAEDAGSSDRRKLVHLAEEYDVPVFYFADRHTLAKPYGRSAQVYVGITSGAFAKKLHHFLLCNTRFNQRNSL